MFDVDIELCVALFQIISQTCNTLELILCRSL